jgi:hypothetical protein
MRFYLIVEGAGLAAALTAALAVSLRLHAWKALRKADWRALGRLLGG